MKTPTITLLAAATALTLTACAAEDGEPLHGKDVEGLANACALSPLTETPEGSGKWAPASQWSATESEGEAEATGWYEAPAESQRYSVFCEAQQTEGGWNVTSVEITPAEVTEEELSEDELAALTTAYGENYNPNQIIRLRAMCSGSLTNDMAHGEADGAKVLCPEATHLDG